jgi:type I restriction enzyme S subunit
MTVERVRVGDVLALQRREVVVEPDEFYTLVGVYSFGKGIFHRHPKPGSELGDYRFFSVVPGDLVLSNIQAWEGAIAYATESDRGAIGTHRFLSYVPRDGRIDTNWARWFFLSEQGMDLIRMAAPGTTIRNRTLAIERFEALEIPLPPIDEQRRIAQYLDATADASTVIGDLANRAAKLSEALVVSLATRPDLDENAKRRAGWELRRLGEVLAAKTSAAVDVVVHDEYPIAGVYSFGRGVIDRGVISGSETSYKSLTRLDKDDVVFSKLGAWEGAVAVVPADFDGFHVSSEFPTFEVDHGLLEPAFLSGVVRSPEFWALMNSGTQGSMARRKRINPSQFLATEIWLPPVEQQSVASELMRRATDAGLPRKQVTERLAALVPAAMNEVFVDLT